jgi:hypothetical protein
MRYELDSDLMVKAAKEYGKAHGFRGNHGGWISNADGTTTVQGWWLFFRTHSSLILDELTRRLTAFDTLDDMVLHTAPTYRPTIRPTTWRERLLADAYDWRMARRGDDRRAYRGLDARCRCGHGPSRHFHADGSSTCTVCPCKGARA